jgi:hypothetical protein
VKNANKINAQKKEYRREKLIDRPTIPEKPEATATKPPATPAKKRFHVLSTVPELRKMAKDRGHRGYSRMNNAQLQDVLNKPPPPPPTASAKELRRSLR